VLTRARLMLPLRCIAGDRASHRGVALLTILAVLTVVALLAATLAIVMQIEMMSAATHQEGLRIDLLMRSGLEHAEASLTALALPGAAAHTAVLTPPAPAGATPWFEVRDQRGRAYGRYRVRISDEAAKVNMAGGLRLAPSPGSGWSPGEINLQAALGVSSARVQRLMAFRLGPNGVPGARGDDDGNNLLLMSDGIDNNANGVIDEDNEGVDDPGEYTVAHPQGDDRAFSSMGEVASVLLGGDPPVALGIQRAVRRAVRQRATVSTADVPGSRTMPQTRPADINAVTVRECRQVLNAANEQRAFESSPQWLNALAANIVDYRDQNHVLSTLGSVYGVEAVCFNEVLANDGTEGRYTSSSLNCFYIRGEYNTTDLSDNNPDFVVGSSSLFYEFILQGGLLGPSFRRFDEQFYRSLNYRATPDNANFSLEGGWDVEIDSNNRVQLLGPSKRFTAAGVEELWGTERWRRYQNYRRLRAALGTFGPRTRRGSPFVPRGNDETYQTFTWPVDFFKNCYISLSYTLQNMGWGQYISRGNFRNATPSSVKILGSTSDGGLTTEHFTMPATPPAPSNTTRAIIWGWRCDTTAEAYLPDMPLCLTFQALQPRKYYLPVANCWQNPGRPRAHLGFAEYPQVLQDDRPYPTSGKRWSYGGDGEDATPVRSNPQGLLDVFLKSGHTLRGTSSAVQDGNAINGVTLLRPEAMELVNLGVRPIAVKNWTLTFNSGSIANDIGSIVFTDGFDPRGPARQYNPAIAGQSVLYLVNNEKLFNAEFGNGRPVAWGRSATQTAPVWEIPNDAWGVQYTIDKVTFPDRNHARVFIKNDTFTPDQFQGEVLELQDMARPAARRDAAHGSRFAVQTSGRNWLQFYFDRIEWLKNHFPPWSRGRQGVDTVMLLGMPAKGGVVSMTLKNEYKQITARTTTYAFREAEPRSWYGQSAEKLDPSQYAWRMRRNPSFSGVARQAWQPLQRGGAADIVKNGAFSSVAEVRRVHSGKAQTQSSQAARATTAALLGVFANASVRLDAADPRGVRRGWAVAADTVRAVHQGVLQAAQGGWEREQWRGHTLTFLTGRLRGESYPVMGNSADALHVSDGAAALDSVPNRRTLQPAPGDAFALGPGYATPLCYTRTPNVAGEWTWHKRVAVPGVYDLYIVGLNDTINTTEFLEENYNAALDVAVWNFTTQTFDLLCRRGVYGKDDTLHAGQLTPAHISPDGDVRLQLTAHGLRDEQQTTEGAPAEAMQRVRARRSGFAWFNYAVLTPVPVPGRINVNTASVRTLQSLPGMTAALAGALQHGTDAAGVARLKPYTNLGDLLDVRGMTPELLERFCNLLTVDSTTFDVVIEAQTLAPSAGGAVRPHAARSARYVVRLQVAADGTPRADIIARD
jgi:hypothetical protein